MYEMWVLYFWTKIEELNNLVGRWLDLHLINILAILIGAWIVRHFASRVIRSVVNRTVREDLYPAKTDRQKRIKTLDTLVGAIVRVGVYIIATILIIGEINPQYTTALFASAGLIGVALGFGAKDLINDFMSGIFIITENQYRVGDVIEIVGVSGTVEDITIRTTVLRDLDGNLHHVPNGSIKLTTNMTLGYSCVNENIVVDYDTDIDRLEHVINHVGEEMASDAKLGKKIIEAPHFLRIDGFGENGIIIKILAKTVSGEQWDVKAALYKHLKVAFEKNHIVIPYQHVVYEKDAPVKK
jgi:moderate conductance mechanosensitive channel